MWSGAGHHLRQVRARPACRRRGLGLSYVMNVVREHGGYVTVESVEGKFSEFTLSLPLPDESPEADGREG